MYEEAHPPFAKEFQKRDNVSPHTAQGPGQRHGGPPAD